MTHWSFIACFTQVAGWKHDDTTLKITNKLAKTSVLILVQFEGFICSHTEDSSSRTDYWMDWFPAEHHCCKSLSLFFCLQFVMCCIASYLWSWVCLSIRQSCGCLLLKLDVIYLRDASLQKQGQHMCLLADNVGREQEWLEVRTMYAQSKRSQKM